MTIKLTGTVLLGLCFYGYHSLYNGRSSSQVMGGASAIIFTVVFALVFAMRYRKNKPSSIWDFLISGAIAVACALMFTPSIMPSYPAKALKQQRIQAQK